MAGDVLDVADAVDLRLDGHDRRLDLRIIAEHGHAVFLDDLLIARGHVEHLEGDAGVDAAAVQRLEQLRRLTDALVAAHRLGRHGDGVRHELRHLFAVVTEEVELGVDAEAAGELRAHLLVGAVDELLRAFSGDAHHDAAAVGKRHAVGAVGETAHSLHVAVIGVPEHFVEQRPDPGKICLHNFFSH